MADQKISALNPPPTGLLATDEIPIARGTTDNFAVTPRYIAAYLTGVARRTLGTFGG